MLLIVTAAGMLGSILLGLRGLAGGSQLDRIVALMCLFAAAAGALGSLIDDGRREPKKRSLLTRDERLQLAVATPLIMLMTGVFLVTLIPSIYVLIPVYTVWRHAVKPRAEPIPTHVPEPAFAH